MRRTSATLLLLAAYALVGAHITAQVKNNEHIPQIVDITASTGIHFNHSSSPERSTSSNP